VPRCAPLRDIVSVSKNRVDHTQAGENGKAWILDTVFMIGRLKKDRNSWISPPSNAGNLAGGRTREANLKTERRSPFKFNGIRWLCLLRKRFIMALFREPRKNAWCCAMRTVPSSSTGSKAGVWPASAARAQLRPVGPGLPGVSRMARGEIEWWGRATRAKLVFKSNNAVH
jgi:hypothetical protein